MSVKKVIQVASPVAMAVLLVSCGAGTTDVESGTDLEPIRGAANGVTNPPEEIPNAGTPISGRVADGYIQGATVCVDLNKNDSCDDDEPSTVTGAGGSYDLTVPDGAQDKPIVADIPATAIDEDTGEAIGKPLVFIAPSDQPEFVSPITTLVHQELQSNPSLNTEDAENAVKTLLGVSDEDVSLFSDYVAGGKAETGDTDNQNNFRYLHDTARVVTSMMKGIEADVESAAQSNGIDVVGSEDTQRAIRDIVRREVRQLLPQIAQQVADIFRTEGAEGTDQDSGAQDSDDFDPDRIAQNLQPEDVSRDLQARIDAVVNRVDPVQADLKQALTEGIYFMEFDCEYEDYVVESGAVELDSDSREFADGAGEDGQLYVSAGQNCKAYYGTVQLNDAGNELLSQNYGFDPQSGTWVNDEFNDDDSADYVLIGGEWQQSTSSGPQGDIEFAADGSALITNSEGTMRLKAVTQNLDATEVKKHLLSDFSDPAWFELVQPTDMFPSGSQVHTVSVKQTLHPYVLFNEQHYDDGGESSCAEFFDNCNVVGNAENKQFFALSSLTDVREAAIQGTQLTTRHSSIGPGTHMTIMMDEEYDGTLPEGGTVEWSFGYHDHGQIQYAPDGEYPEDQYVEPGNEATYPADLINPDECYVTDEHSDISFPGVPEEKQLFDEDVEFPVSESPDSLPEPGSVRPPEVLDPDGSQDLEEAREKEKIEGYPQDISPLPVTEGCVDFAAQNGEFKEPAELSEKLPVDEHIIKGRWKLVEVDGVDMIEIQLPDSFRDDQSDAEQAMLLIEQNGFVRLGVKMADTYIDRVPTYNETAFTTLRAIVERNVDKK